MEPEVHIIEKYYQEVLHCFTMTNIRCKGNKEIDILAINPKTLEKFHVESRVTTSLKLRFKATYTKDGRCHRNGLDYFQKEKFEHPSVKQKIRELFGKVDYHKILVVWRTMDHKTLTEIAEKEYGIEIMPISLLILKFTSDRTTSGSRDDILRTMELVSLVGRMEAKILKLIARKGHERRTTVANVEKEASRSLE